MYSEYENDEQINVLDIISNIENDVQLKEINFKENFQRNFSSPLVRHFVFLR